MNEDGLRKASNLELLKKLMQAAAKAGVSGSGLVSDPAAGMHREELLTLKEQVLARLNQDETEVKKGTIISIPEGKWVHGKGGVLSLGPGEYQVKRTRYLDEGAWYVELVDQKLQDRLYPLAGFHVHSEEPILA